jgi:hypothetical protein
LKELDARGYGVVRFVKDAAPQPSPQASAEDVELVGLAIKEHAARYPGSATEAAFERIRADVLRLLEVGRE